MVFYIDSSIKDHIDSYSLDEPLAFFFSELANAHQHGYCLLCGNLESLESLRDVLGSPASSVYRTIAANYTEHRSALELVSFVFILTFCPDEVNQRLPAFLKGKDKIIPLSAAIKWHLNDSCCLLAENLEDCKFYQLVGENYRIKHQGQGLKIEFHIENGGGNTTCDVLKKCVQIEKRPTLCIVDSDQKYGTTNTCRDIPRQGDTLHRVLDIQQELRVDMDTDLLFQVYPLPVHEVENLIPLSVLDLLTEDLPSMKPGLTILNELKPIYNGKPILYYDFKNGISSNCTPQATAYWEEISKAINKWVDTFPFQDPGDSQIFPPLSRNRLLERANKIIHPPIDSLDEYLSQHWENLGAVILAWGCAGLPHFA